MDHASHPHLTDVSQIKCDVSVQTNVAMNLNLISHKKENPGSDFEKSDSDCHEKNQISSSITR